MLKTNTFFAYHGIKQLMHTGAITALTLALSTNALAQTSDITIEEDQTQTVRTSTAGDGDTPADVTIGSTDNPNPTITLTTAGPAVILDSSNNLTNGGIIAIDDVDNATGVELQGGADRSYTQTGAINIIEDFTPTNTDDDVFIDGGVAEGTGRTGILISGASPFAGDINLTNTSVTTVEGNDSFGINLANTPMMMDGLTGNLTTEGLINVTGDNSTGINLSLIHI